MGLLDKIKGLAGQHSEKVEGGIDKVADVVDEKTGGRYSDKIDRSAEAARDFVGGDAENVAVGGDAENVTVGGDAENVAVGGDAENVAVDEGAQEPPSRPAP